jgi:Rhodopirellula transposase DDE domain
LKKIAETEAIFENVAAANQAADNNLQSLRLSIDSKAKVKIGNLSRGGKARSIEPITASDQTVQALYCYMSGSQLGRVIYGLSP